MTVSLQAFRDRYPDAKITSELLLAESDRFVVKVTVELAAAGCASGLAAHNSVEIAEDRARLRALAALGWQSDDSPPDEIDHELPPFPNESAESALTTPATLSPVEQTADSQLDGRSPVSMPDNPAIGDAQPAKSQNSEPPAAGLHSRPKPAKAASAKTKTIKQHTSTAAPAVEPESATTAAAATPSAPPAAPISSEALPAPINLSDVIAQTDIELRRLGWSVETGRDYLEKTYQKRSRHELSEEELIQFLCHLESL